MQRGIVRQIFRIKSADPRSVPDGDFGIAGRKTQNIGLTRQRPDELRRTPFQPAAVEYRFLKRENRTGETFRPQKKTGTPGRQDHLFRQRIAAERCSPGERIVQQELAGKGQAGFQSVVRKIEQIVFTRIFQIPCVQQDFLRVFALNVEIRFQERPVSGPENPDSVFPEGVEKGFRFRGKRNRFRNQ